jgi:hypothetical protein
MIAEAADLYRVDPADFVAARKQLARDLKAAERPDDAAVVAKLPKPRVAELALNRVARDEPELARRYADAVRAATAAQSQAIGGGGGGDALRATSAELRAATAAVVDAAARQLDHLGRDSATQRDDVLAIVRSLTSDDAVAELTAGVLGSGSAPGSGELFAGAPEPAPRPVRPAKVPQRSRRRPPDLAGQTSAAAAEPHPPTKAELAAERRRRQHLEQAETALAHAERDVRAAERALEQAQERLAGARAARDAAAARLTELRDQI